MHHNSWWSAAALAVLLAIPAFPQGAVPAPADAPFGITVVTPQRARQGDEVVVWVSRELVANAKADLAVTVAGEQAPIRAVAGRAITITVPATLAANAEAPVRVSFKGRPSENAPPIVILPAVSATAIGDSRAVTYLWFGIAAIVVGLVATYFAVRNRLRVKELEARRVVLERALVSEPVETSNIELVENENAAEEKLLLPEALVRACAAGECVLFAGQGVDVIAGYPLLRAVLDEVVRRGDFPPTLRQQLEQGLSLGEIDAVVDILLTTSAAPDLNDRIARAFRDSPPRRGALDVLRNIDFAAVVTTSWTPLLMQVFRNREPLEIPLSRTENVSDLLQSQRFPLIRLLGYATALDSLILTRAEMRQLIRRNEFFAKYLTSLLSARTHVFIGASPTTIDEYFSALQWGPSTIRHFAVLQADRRSGLAREQLKARYGIEVIETPATALTDGTRRFVEDLARAVQAEKPVAGQRKSPDVPTLGRLVLENIGPFKSLDLKLSPGWNVILGNNGSGKSTILRAVAAALCGDEPRAAVAADRLLRADSSTGFVELTIGSDVYRAEFIRELSRVRVVNRQLTPLQTGKAFVLGFPAVRGITPPKGTSADTSGDIVPNPDVADVLPLITGDVDPRTDSVKQWLINLESRRLRAGSESWRLADLRNRFFELLNVFTPGLRVTFASVDFDVKQVFVKTEDSDVPIPIDYVSQGMISVIAWVGTLLQRMYAVRAKSASPTQEPAIVLIDEIDAHLHPEWQQEIIGRLKTAFPQVQFIATTHSPLVVAGLRREDVFVAVRDENTNRITVTPSPIHFEGLRADQILTSPLFGLSSTRQLHVDRHAELLAKRERTPAEEQELAILQSSIGETDESLKTKRLRHALDELASEEGFEALLSGQTINSKMRDRLLSAISGEEKR